MFYLPMVIASESSFWFLLLLSRVRLSALGSGSTTPSPAVVVEVEVEMVVVVVVVDVVDVEVDMEVAVVSDGDWKDGIGGGEGMLSPECKRLHFTDMSISVSANQYIALQTTVFASHLVSYFSLDQIIQPIVFQKQRFCKLVYVLNVFLFI